MRISRSGIIINEDKLYVCIPKPCKWCDRLFYPVYNAMKYCCDDCRRKAHNKSNREYYKRKIGYNGQ